MDIWEIEIVQIIVGDGNSKKCVDPFIDILEIVFACVFGSRWMLQTVGLFDGRGLQIELVGIRYFLSIFYAPFLYNIVVPVNR